MSSYCWRPEWILPFESPWSVIEKFKYANNVNSREVLKLVGTQHVKNIRAAIGHCHRDLITLAGFDEDSVLNVIKFNLTTVNKELLQKIKAPLPERYTLKQLFRQYLAYCEKCMSTGFHSILHQFKLLHHCPFHQTPLVKACPECNQVIPYYLTDKELIGAFECRCGYKFFQSHNHKLFYSAWAQSEKIIPDISHNWLNFNEDKAKKTKYVHLFMEKDLESYPNVFHYLSNLNNSTEVLTSPCIIKSTKNIRDIKGELQKEENTKYSRRGIHQVSEIQLQKYRYICMQEDLQKSYHCTITAIARHLRNTILAKHKTCIKRYYKETDNEKKCPYAFAYLHWRCFVQGFSSAKHVDEKILGMGYKYLEPKHLHYPNWQDSDYLRALHEEWENCVEDITVESRASLKWIFNRAISNLVFNRFWGWLQEAPEKMEKYITLGLPKFKYEYQRAFFFVLPTNNGEQLEFHYETEEDKDHILNQLKCPFQTIKSKRKRLRINGVNPKDRWLPL